MSLTPTTQKPPTSLTLFPSSNNKPALAKFNEDFVKIRNIQTVDEINGLVNFMVRILNIKVSTPAEKQELDAQMVLALDLIRKKFGGLTIPEVEEAFKMYVAHEFDIKVFRLLDCVAIGEILNAYIEFRNESLRVYTDKKQKAEQESEKLPREEVLQIMKSGTLDCFFEYLETGLVDDGKFYIFQTLYQIEVLPKPEPEDAESRPIAHKYAHLRSVAKSQIMKEIAIATGKEIDKGKKQTLVDEYESAKADDGNPAVNNRAMALVLVGFFDKLKLKEHPMAALEKLVDDNIEKYIYE